MERIAVECIVKMKDKEIAPLRLRYEDHDGAHVVKVDRILQQDKKTTMAYMDHPRTTEYSFRCEAVQDGISKSFTLTFNADSCRWWMYMK